ncbi:MAG: DUF883 domain-containing protein [Burkholderiaceae bacterium]|nr:DUF883 domain-containing protein [Burkholderiaceae bacterium]
MSASTPSSNFEETTGQIVDDLASDVRNTLDGKDFDAVPGIEALRARVNAKLAAARDLAAEKTKQAAHKAREAADAASAYAHKEPWQVAGMALGVGLLVGLVLGRRK